jgi:hypothetical protein
MYEGFQLVSDTFGVMPDILKWLLFPMVLFPSFIAWRYTGNSIVVCIVNMMIYGFLTFIGIMPFWMMFIGGVFTFGYLGLRLFSGEGDLGMPNQLIQKPRKENRNLCNTCFKQETCEDYKRLKYADICDEYRIKTAKPVLTKPIEIVVSVNLEQRLSKDLQAIKFDKGLRTFNNLKSEVSEVKGIFENCQTLNNSFIDVDKTKKLVEDIYNKSLNFLSLTLDIYKQVNVTTYDELRMETEELQESFNGCTNPNSILYKTLKEAIDKNYKMLDLIKKNKDRIDELFGQISLCKDAIMEIRLGLPELLHHQSNDALNVVLAESKDRIAFGQRLLDEYKSQGL